MKKQLLFVLLCVVTMVACSQDELSTVTIESRSTLSASVESVTDGTRAGMESDGSFFWHEGDKIGVLMTSNKVRPMTLVKGDGGKSSGSFTTTTSETFGKYAIYPYSKDKNSVDANGNLTITFPAEYNYGSVIGEKENSFGFAMWGQIVNDSVAFKHLGGVFKIYVHNLPVGDGMQFTFSTTGKKLTGEFTTNLTTTEPMLETSNDDVNDTVTITFNNSVENGTAVFYIPTPVGTYPEIDVVITDAEGEEIAFGYWTNQTVKRRAQKKGEIGEKTITGGEEGSTTIPATGGELVGEHTLTADITLEQPLTVPAGKEAIVNLNGKSITNTSDPDIEYFDIFYVEEGATLTINGEGNVEAVDGIEGFCVFAEGNVIINGGTYKSGFDAEGAANACIYADKGNITIYGGEFESADGSYVLNLKDNSDSHITVYGGKFHNFDPANNASENPAQSFVAEGYISVETSENVWEVFPATEPVEVATAAALEDVLAQGASAVLTANITANGAITVPATATSTIDLNGNTLDYSAATMGEALITNRGNLTIKGQGEVAYTYTGEADSAYGKGNYTISNCGTLTIDGATISNNTAKMSHAYYAIDNNSNNTSATLTINSGKVVNTTSYAIRQIANKDNYITVNGGEVEGTRAFWIQLPGSNTAVAPNATLNVNGGTLNATGETGYKLAVYSYNYGNDLKNVKINITDGVVNGDIALTGGTNKTNIESVNISGGTINGDVYSYGKDAIAAEAAINITGGTISNNTLYVLPYVGSNAEQLNIKISEDMVAESAIVIPASATVVLDLNGKTIGQENAQTATYAMIENKGTLTIKDSVGGGKVSYADTTVYTADVNYASNTIRNDGTLTIESGIIENISSDNVMTYGYPHAIDVYPGSVTNIKGGTVKSVNYDCIRMFCNSTTVATTVNISGGNIINRVSFQNPSSNQAGYGRLNITGGTFTSTVDKANVRLLNFSTDVSNMKAEITGGTFDKGVSTSNYSSWTANWDWLTIGEGVTINKL